MEGEISLDSSYSNGIDGCPGARLIITLPPVPLTQSGLEESSSSDTVSSEIYSYGLPEQLSVRLVDDDHILRKMMIRSLKRLAPGWIIQEAANGETALFLTENFIYDLIFLDQYMASAEKQLLGTETGAAMR